MGGAGSRRIELCLPKPPSNANSPPSCLPTWLVTARCRDDKLALELLEEHRQLLREIFPRFNGTEIKTIGDAFLIEFNSALEAAQCAIEIQRTLAKRNHDVTADRHIELKIGIHIGDVVHRGGDVMATE